MSPDEDELEFELDEDESDDLDALDDPRITEVDTDEEKVPKLIAKAEKKGKNKRSADELEEDASLDDIMAKALKPKAAEEPKLSKKQLKKLKKNNGDAVSVKPEELKNGDLKDAVSTKSEKSDKKVQFAKNLEQGPTGSAEKAKVEAAAPAKDNKAGGVKVINGVKIDDKKLGTGPACKKGDRVGLRYIGKLTDGKVFDCKSGNCLTHPLKTDLYQQRIRRASHFLSSSEVAGSSKVGISVSPACQSEANEESPFPHNTLMAAKACPAYLPTAPLFSTSSCWRSSKLRC